MPKIQISLGSSELALEGSEDFLNEYQEAIRAMLEELTDSLSGGVRQSEESGLDIDTAGRESDLMDLEFGQALQLLPRTATGSDQILLAAKFAQHGNDENTFSTREANSLLEMHGIKLSNASQAVKNNIKAKRVFRAGDHFRISRNGEEHLQGLLAKGGGDNL